MNTLLNTAILASVIVAALLAAQGGWANPTDPQVGIGGHYNLQPIW